MFRNYFIVSIRNLLKEKTFSIVNILGLAIGMVISLLIFRYIQFENNYDTYHKDSERIYRVSSNLTLTGFGEWNNARCGASLAPVLVSEFPEIETAVRVGYFGPVKILQRNEEYTENKLIYADSSLFDVFSYKLLKGNKNALNEPNTVLITNEVAQKFFGNENPIGQFIGDTLQFKVVGIIDKVPDNSHLRFNMVVSFVTLKRLFPIIKFENSWDDNIFTYLKLRKGFEAPTLSNKLKIIVDKYVDKKDYKSIKYYLEPLKDLHTKSDSETYLPDFSLKFMGVILKMFIIVAFVILIISSINFINISIARSTVRAKEVGLRKLLGASRKNLIQQFFFEFFISTILAMILAIFLVELLLPAISNWVGRDISIDYLHNSEFVLVIVCMTLFTGIVAGLYPSVILSSFSPLRVFKFTLKGRKGGLMRKILMVTQFTISIFFALFSIFIFQQANYFYDGNFGFAKEDLIVIRLTKMTSPKYTTFKTELLKKSNIQSVTACSNEPGVYGGGAINISGDDLKERSIPFIAIDNDYFKTLGVSILNSDKITDLSKNEFYITNKTIEKFEWKTAVGKNVELYLKEKEKIVPQYAGKIVGVVNDFAVRETIERSRDAIFVMDSSKFRNVLIRIQPQTLKSTVSSIEQAWTSLYPKIPFKYSLLTTDLSNAFFIKLGKELGKFFFYTAIFSIIIALLGFFGLTAFAIRQRLKEICIRKIFGTPQSSLIFMLTKEFLILILISNLIGGFLEYYFMDSVLADFSFHIQQKFYVFISVGFVTICLAAISVSYIIYQIARQQPSEILRYE